MEVKGSISTDGYYTITNLEEHHRHNGIPDIFSHSDLKMSTVSELTMLTQVKQGHSVHVEETDMTYVFTGESWEEKCKSSEFTVDTGSHSFVVLEKPEENIKDFNTVDDAARGISFLEPLKTVHELLMLENVEAGDARFIEEFDVLVVFCGESWLPLISANKTYQYL